MSSERLVISRVPMPERAQFLVYDLQMARIVAEISDYAVELGVKRQYSELTVEQGLRHLMEFWNFMLSKPVRLHAVADRTISEFRDQNYKKVRSSKAHRGHPDHAKVTVNLKLERIYDWLVWLQKTRRVPVGTVGRNGLVTAIIEAPIVLPRIRGKWRPAYERKYPLLFKVGNRNAKHNAPASVVSDEHVDAVFALFHERYEPFVAQRNILFADIAEAAGFRRGSICSLCVDQFELSAIEASKGEFLVRPPRQKFGYTNTFGIEVTLAYRIRQFIDDHWLPWVDERGIGAAVHQNRLFLSAKTGRPIMERSMTQIISGAFRDLGFDKGVGPHMLRGKFASEESDHELEERRQLGLDTSNTSIAAALAMKLGQNDPDQFYRYASSSQARKARIARDGRMAELKALREENRALKAELERMAAGSDTADP